MIIKPYSDIAAETFVAADFPALKHFWACKDASPTLIADLVGTADVTPDAANGAPVTAGNGITIYQGTHTAASALTAPGTGSCIWIACGTWGGTNNGLAYGSMTATGGISCGTVSTAARVYDGTTTKTCAGGATAVQTAGAYTRVNTIRSVAGVPTEAMTFEVSSADGYTLDTYDAVADLTAVTAITNIAAVEQQLTSATSEFTLYGAAFFKFAGALPPKEKIMAMAAWCDYQWRNSSNVCMYPGFKGLS